MSSLYNANAINVWENPPLKDEVHWMLALVPLHVTPTFWGLSGFSWKANYIKETKHIKVIDQMKLSV